MRLDPKLWRHFGGSQLMVDAGVLVVLGGVMALVLLHPEVLTPLEGALLMAGVGFLLILGRRALAWPRAVPTQAFLPEWAERTLAGERRPTPHPHDLSPDQVLVARALSAAMQEILELRDEVAFLRRTVSEDWAETDVELDRLEQAREEGIQAQARMIQEMEVLGGELKQRLNSPELAQRVTLRTRGLGIDTDMDRSLFQEEVAQIRHNMERLTELMDHVKDSIPRLRKDAELLTALGFSSGRRASRLWASIQSLSGQSERMLEASHARREGLAALRGIGDRLREAGEGLRRRISLVRKRGESAALPLGRIEESIKAIHQVAHQTGLLAVNAAILAKDQRGTRGFEVIGSKIRLLAEQTALGAAEVSRGVAEHRQGMDTEERRIEELQEAVDAVLSVMHDFQGMHAQLDHQGMDLERTLESHQELVRHLESAGASAVEALRDIHHRADGIESSVLRQRATEQESAREMQELGGRLERIEEHALRVIRSEESALADLWLVLDRHAQVRGSASFRAFQSGRFDTLTEELAMIQARERESWRRMDWARASHQRLMPELNEGMVTGYREASGRLHLQLMRVDAVGMPRLSCLSRLTTDAEGRTWKMILREGLRGHDCALALLVALRESLSGHWFHQPEVLLDDEGVRLDLGMPFPEFPDLLAGLEVTLILPDGSGDIAWQPARPLTHETQRFLWLHPSLDREVRSSLHSLLHDQVAHLPAHECVLPGMKRKDQAPCIRCARRDLDPVPRVSLAGARNYRSLGVGMDPLPGRVWVEALGFHDLEAADAKVILGAVSLPFPRPEALLLPLMHPSADLGFEADPALKRIAEAYRTEVLGSLTGNPTQRAWALLDELVAGEWLVPLPD